MSLAQKMKPSVRQPVKISSKRCKQSNRLRLNSKLQKWLKQLLNSTQLQKATNNPVSSVQIKKAARFLAAFSFVRLFMDYCVMRRAFTWAAIDWKVAVRSRPST